MGQEPLDGQEQAVTAGKNTAHGGNAHDRQQGMILAEAEVMEESVGNFRQLVCRKQTNQKLCLMLEQIMLCQNAGVDLQTDKGKQRTCHNRRCQRKVGRGEKNPPGR